MQKVLSKSYAILSYWKADRKGEKIPVREISRIDATCVSLYEVLIETVGQSQGETTAQSQRAAGGNRLEVWSL